MAQTTTRDVSTDPAQAQTMFPRVLQGAFIQEHIALMTHVSRLQAYENPANPGEYLFSVVVTPAVADAQDPLHPTNPVVLEDGTFPAPLTLDDLLPWKLGSLNVAVAVQTGPVTALWTAVPAANVTVLPLPAVPEVPGTADTDHLKDWLEQRILAAAANTIPRIARQTLARSATSIFPHNFVLQQAVCLKVTGLPAATTQFRVAVLPVFGQHAGAQPIPGGQAPSGTGQNVSMVGWDAGIESVHHQFAVAAYQEAVEFPASTADQDPRFDPVTQRVALADASASAGESGDWLRLLPVRCAGLFDLAQRLIEAVRAQPASFGSAAARDQIWQWILATSRDYAGVGWKIGPSNANLPLDVAQAVLTGIGMGTGGFTPAVRALAGALTTALQTYDATIDTPEKWLLLLQPPQSGDPTVLSSEQQRVATLFADLPATWPAGTSLDDSLLRWSRFISDLRNPANLRSIVVRQWKAALTSPIQGNDPTVICSWLQQILNSTESPVNLLARGVIGDFWPAIIHVQDGAGPVNPVDVIPGQALAQFSTGYLTNRNLPASGFFPLPGVVQPPLTLFDVNQAKAALFPSSSAAPAQNGTQPSPERTPQPLVFQVGKVAASANATQRDFLRQLAGVVVFLRDASKPQARCLNLGRVALPAIPTAAPPIAAQTLDALVLGPRRLGYLNGTSTSHLTYNNASLLARSEGGRINEIAGNTLPASYTPGNLGTPYFELPPLGDALRPKVRLPGLAYGRNYLVSGFAVLNAGILPPQIARPDHPAVLLPIADAGFTIADPGGLDLRISYLRMVGIGAPTFPPEPGAKPGTTKLPAAFAQQPDVAPLALEILAAQGLPPSQTPPLAILYPPNQASPTDVSFSLSKSATDFENWDRWVVGNGFRPSTVPDLPALRIQVRENTAQARDNSATSVAPVLDDPALEDSIYVTAELLFAEPAATPPAPLLVALTTTNPLRSDALPVTISHGAAAAPSAGVTSGTLQVKLPAGSVWRLKFYSVIKQTALSSLGFVPVSVPVSGSTTLLAVSPLEILVELATTNAPDWPALHAALKPQILGRQAVLDLERPTPNFAFLSRVEADLQVWSWSGRPIEPFQFGTFAADLDGTGIQQWDVGGFGHRQDSACRTHVTRMTWSSELDSSVKPVRLFVEDREGDPRALYFRWSLRAFSRYPRLNPEPVTPLGQPQIRWSRAILPARLTDRLLKPSLKLILPLGSRVVEGQSGPCLAVLAVFHDAWYKQAGLAEQLEVQLVTTTYQPPSPPLPPPPEQTFLQAGHDPIVSTTPLPNLAAPVALPSLIVQPPVGHTFDKDVSEPLIVGSSFNILLPATLQAASATGGGPLSISTSDWFLAALRFRRNVDPAGTLAGADPTASLASEWTATEWVQFAPAPKDLLPTGWATADVAAPPVKLSYRQATKWVVDQWVEPYARLPLPAGGLSPNRFDYWFVITRETQDLNGQPAEAYVATLGTMADSSVDQIDTAPDAPYYITAATGVPLILRVLELRTRDRVALRAKLVVNGNPWTLLFSDAASANPMTASANAVREDAVAQITRISPPVRVKTDVSN